MFETPKAIIEAVFTTLAIIIGFGLFVLVLSSLGYMFIKTLSTWSGV
jgi:hypothetical protein